MAVARHFFDYRRDLIFLNTHHGPSLGESDMVIVRSSGWAMEVEVKISWADFRADLAKGQTKRDPGKHDRLALGDPRYTPFSAGRSSALDLSDRSPHTCRHFYFAAPSELATRIQPVLPLHAGLLAVDSKLRVHEVTAAPRLNARKIEPDTLMKLYRSLYFKHWDRLLREHHRRLRTGQEEEL